MTEKIYIQSKNGKIAALIDLPQLAESEQCALAVVLHGIGDHKDTPFMRAIANGLYNRGIGSLRIDFNGHGESDGTFTNMTISKEVDDAIAALEYAKSLPQAKKVYIVGHSQGGIVASLTAGLLGDYIDGVELLAPAVVLKDGAKNGNILGGEFDPEHLPETLPIVWGVLGKHYIEDARELPIYETINKYSGPVNIIHGTADAVVPYTYAEELNEKSKNSRLNLLSGYGHSFEPNNSLCVELIGDFFKELSINNDLVWNGVTYSGGEYC